MGKFSEEEIKKVNNKFYEALNSCNLELMQDIWLNDSNVKCVHPAWPMIRGWESVIDSWKNIFELVDSNHVDVSQLFIDIKGKSAWVNCVERISYRINNEVMIMLAQTTNIFEFINENWCMVLHHASPMPVPASEVDDINLQ